MRSYLLWLRYDGTDFCGWQRQSNLRTVQGELETALARVAGTSFRLSSSSRTDAGVHAMRHPVAVHLDSNLPPVALNRGLNSLLPHDLSVVDVWSLPSMPGFSARKTALGKTYTYRISQLPYKDPFLARYSWHVTQHLDAQAMTQASLALLGEHDFSAFRAADCDARSPLRRVFSIIVENDQKEIKITINGNAFLRNMVRIIAGTLVDVGRGKHDPGWVGDLILKRDRTQAGRTAPPWGLCLADVDYPPEIVAFSPVG